MTKYGPEEESTLDRVFHALADGTRRAVLARLVHGPASVSQLAELSGFALPTVLQHLRVLDQAGLVTSDKVGRVRSYQLVPDATVAAKEWIASHRMPREKQLDRLAAHLATPPPASTEKER